MKIKYDGFNHLVRLQKGELLMASLSELVKNQNVPSCWISGLGAAEWVELGFYDLPNKRYNWQKFNQPLEILSLQGNLAWDGSEPVFHIHGSFSSDKFNAIGGHVKELEVAGTCEIFLHKWYAENLRRTQDEETGLNLLDL